MLMCDSGSIGAWGVGEGGRGRKARHRPSLRSSTVSTRSTHTRARDKCSSSRPCFPPGIGFPYSPFRGWEGKESLCFIRFLGGTLAAVPDFSHVPGPSPFVINICVEGGGPFRTVTRLHTMIGLTGYRTRGLLRIRRALYRLTEKA
jgi:hypothetical protein